MNRLQKLTRAGLALGAMSLFLAALPIAAQPVGITPTQTACPMVVDPIPNGINARPQDVFADPNLFPNPTTSNDYHWLHSSTHLQGEATREKFAPCLFYNPSKVSGADLSGFTSALIVNNPDPVLPANVTIVFRSPAGVQLGAAVNVTIPPDGTWANGAIQLAQFGNGLGSAQITSDIPVVGGSIHHTGAVTLGGTPVTDPDPFQPGAASMQQLQRKQGSQNDLYWGPIPLTNASGPDFLNGVLPTFCIANPTANPVNVTVGQFLSNGTVLSSQTTALAPFGMFVDTTIWSLAEPAYLAGPGPFNTDAEIFANADGPILGEGLMTDFFGNGGGTNLVLGGRFRMGSTMMANTPSRRVVNPELTFTVTTPPVTTLMSVFNATASDIGPVTANYFDRNGNLLSSATLASMPPLTVQRLEPGVFGYPGPTFAGWVRITACKPGLVGWSMREINQQVNPFTGHFRKVYGDILSGSNRREPGNGIVVSVGGSPVIRKVSPFSRVAGVFDFPPFWPGTQIGVNDSAANIGPYSHRFFDLAGNPVGIGNFLGLQFANTSFTYEDPLSAPPLGTNISGRFDHTSGTIEGVDVIGDPLVEWLIPDFPGPTGPGPGTPGPQPGVPYDPPH